MCTIYMFILCINAVQSAYTHAHTPLSPSSSPLRSMKHLSLHLIRGRGIDVYGFTGGKRFCVLRTKQSCINMQSVGDTGVSSHCVCLISTGVHGHVLKLSLELIKWQKGVITDTHTHTVHTRPCIHIDTFIQSPKYSVFWS